MASSSGFPAYVLEQLTRSVPGGDFTARKMMGEYCLYYRDKLIMEICDDQLLVKPTPTVLALMPDADRAYPYEGSKTLMAVVDHRAARGAHGGGIRGAARPQNKSPRAERQ